MSLKALVQSETVSVREIAALLGTTEKTARKYIRTKRLSLEPVRVSGQLRYDLDAVRQAIIDFQPPRVGRPRKTDTAN